MNIQDAVDAIRKVKGEIPIMIVTESWFHSHLPNEHGLKIWTQETGTVKADTLENAVNQIIGKQAEVETIQEIVQQVEEMVKG